MRNFLNKLIAFTLIDIMRDYFLNDICCMNCEYYFVNPDICIIDNQNIPSDLSHIYKCKAFKTWFGVVD